VKIARIELDGATRAAIVASDGVRPLPADVRVLDVLADHSLAARAGDVVEGARLLAPVEPPTIRDFSVFHQHIEGVVLNSDPDAKVPEVWYASPFCYFSNPHAVTGPGDEIPVPPGCRLLDLELEVAAVIGRAGTNLRPEDAEAHIAGYTVFNDWSARDLQRHELQLGLGFCKAKDFANTLGPWIVTPDELERFRRGDRLDLTMSASINGRSLGEDTLASMAWSWGELVSYASRGTWVRPGDVLGSGTCGNGCLLELWGRRGRDGLPPLAPGDTVTLNVKGLGTLENAVVAGVDPIELPRARA
jgi:2-keto-4-pentenoate hydratase/2-oxohepta-3-ene-1,7-dioic acid hydratase in catechol pathway